MKKTILKVMGALTLASSLFLVGCSGLTGNDVYQGNMSSDTVIQLAKPKNLTAVAYPNYIYYSWYAGDANSTKFIVQILNDGAVIDSTVAQATSGKCSGKFRTYNNNLNYTIRVAAEGYTRSIEFLGTEFIEAKATSIVPPAGTHALDFINYEKGAKKAKKGEEPKALVKDDIKVTQDKSNIYVAFPGKIYLGYGIAFDKNYDETNISSLKGVTPSLKVGANNESLNYRSAITQAGTYTVNLKITANGDYDNSYIDDYITLDDKISIESYATIATVDTNDDTHGDAVVKYVESTNGDGDVRLMWTPVEVNGVTEPTDHYKVYVQPQNSIELTAVDATVTEVKDNGAVTYYIDTTVEDTTLTNTFYIVLTDGEKYADECTTVTLAKKSVAYAAKPTITGLVTDVNGDSKDDDIEWTVTLDNANQNKGDYKPKVYLLQKDLDFVGTVVKNDFSTETDLFANADYPDSDDKTEFTIESKALANGKYYLLVVVSEEGKESSYNISVAKTVKVVTE